MSKKTNNTGQAIITLVVGLAVAVGFGLIFLSQFQTAVGNSSAAYTPIGDIITQIQNNVVWVGLIVLAGLGGLAYAIGRSMGII